MPDFTPAEIELARELALPREFREGDWYLRIPADPPTSVRDRIVATELPRCWANVHGDPPTSSVIYPWPVVWLPLEGDCFALLREAGWGAQLEIGRNYDCHIEAWTTEDRDDPTYRNHIREGAPPREALYRLLLVCGIGGKGE